MTDTLLADLYRKFGPLIYSRCRRMLGDDAGAEDATQETFMRVHRNLARAAEVREALSWIYRIATNYCLNELRDKEKYRPALARDPEAQEGAGGGESSASVEDSLADQALARWVVAAVPAKLRAVAWLHYAEGMNQDEVAEALGISRRTVVTRLGEFQSRAQQLLRRSEL